MNRADTNEKMPHSVLTLRCSGLVPGEDWNRAPGSAIQCGFDREVSPVRLARKESYA